VLWRKARVLFSRAKRTAGVRVGLRLHSFVVVPSRVIVVGLRGACPCRECSGVVVVRACVWIGCRSGEGSVHAGVGGCQPQSTAGREQQRSTHMVRP
jgi:hypothetical protein